MRQLSQLIKFPRNNSSALVRRFLSDVAKSEKSSSSPVTREEMNAEFKSVRTEIKSLSQKMDTQIDALSQKMDTQIDALSQKMDTRFEMLNEKVDLHNKHINRLSTAAGAAFLSLIGVFGVYTLSNAKDIGRLEGKFGRSEHNNNKGHLPTTATPTISNKK